jgi:hypothetical protein
MKGKKMKGKTKMILATVWYVSMAIISGVLAGTGFSQGFSAGCGWLVAALLFFSRAVDGVAVLFAAQRIEKTFGKGTVNELHGQLMDLWKGVEMDAKRRGDLDVSNTEDGVEVSTNFGDMPRPDPDVVDKVVKTAHERAKSIRKKMKEE